MANYLPVLLVSLSTNALNVVPDDSSLSTAPRAQVDYLSHDWEEEDVWRSWRNMTRQKNAITNGARLENASWRTWWKQRNKLGTISPETLNWLKDSDVTWLYGPLHTAEEWKPPPRYRPDMSSNPATAAPARPNSPSGHRSRRPPPPSPYKPILKHRSISELLMSELPPTSPILSPLEFWEDSEPDATSGDADAHLDTKVKRPPLLHTKSDTQITRLGSSRAFRKTSPFRIDPGIESGEPSSPRSSSQLLSAGGPVRVSLSQDSNSSGKSAVSGSEHSQGTHKKKHISFNTFVEQCIAIDKPKKNASGYFGAIPATFLGGRAAWVDDDGYDEEREDSEEDMNMRVYVRNSHWKPGGSQSYGVRVLRKEDGSPEEDEEDEEEDDDAPIEIRSSSSRSTSTLRPDRKPLPRSQSKVSNSSSSSASTTRSATSSRSDASHSTTDDTSSPSGSLSPTRRISPSSSILPKASSALGLPHFYRRSATTTSISNYRPSFNRLPRPPPLRPSLESNSRSQHVTIAPIAPTLLKTTPAPSWTENFGDDGTGSGDDIFASWAWGIGGKVGASDSASRRREDRGPSSGLQRRRSWTSGFSSENYGFTPGAFGTGCDPRGMGSGATVTGAPESNDGGYASDGTPVELVYAPPFDFYTDEDFVQDDDPVVPEEESERGPREEEGMDIEQVEDVEEQHSVFHHLLVNSSIVSSSSSHIASIAIDRLPTVIVDTYATTPLFASRAKHSLKTETIADDDDEDPDGYLPDMAEDYYPWRGGRGYDYSPGGTDATRNRMSNPKSSSRPGYAADTKQQAREMERKIVRNGEDRQSRSRSRSESRTPSPALMSSTSSVEPSLADGRSRSYSGSSPLKNSLLPTTSSTRKASSYSELLSPPRGRQLDGPSSRSANVTSPSLEERRGRSNVRASPSSSWDRDRGSSGSLGSSTSPLGSLSPDGGASTRTSSGVGVGFGTALGGGKVEKDREQEWERERERGSRNRRGREKTSSKMLNVATSSEAAVTSPVGKTSIFSVASSSSSSTSSTVMPVQAGPSGKEHDTELMHRQSAEMLRRKSIPSTPTNSPVLGAEASRDSTPAGSATPIQMVAASTSEKGTTKMSPINTSVLSFSPPLSPSTPSPQRSRYRPPLTLNPSPPMPVRPSTSLAAAVSPIGFSNHSAGVMSAQSEGTIVGKAVDMVSNAGMYLGLWGRERVTSLSSGSPT